MREFIKTASECGKIARAKINCEDIGIFAKRVGSNFFLSDRRLAAEFRQSFAALSRARTARALENVAATDSFRVGDTRLERVTSRTQNNYCAFFLSEPLYWKFGRGYPT